MYAEAKKLGQFLDDLKKIKKELVPRDEKDIEREEEMKHMDRFHKKKHELNMVLKKVRDDANRLQEYKRKNGERRDEFVVRIINENTLALKNAKTVWDQLKHLLEEDSKKRGQKLGQKELEDREKTLRLFGEELINLNKQFERVKGAGPNSVHDMEGRTDRTQKKRQERAEKKGRKRKERRGKKGEGYSEFNDADFSQGKEMTAQEQQFMDQVAVNQNEQNEMLDDISKGLVELKEMSLDIKKKLEMQEAIIDEVETEMDSTIAQLKTANSRMKDILDSQGGMTRWCPILCCLCLLLAILGYVFNLVPS
mmetsp:Transcript_20962/g.29528  ORF Transcript_20962/g.29528 Transcript_20962/m.29528 type:complete len:309 (+) Transcript_20962:45-971(+)|eukprot:CAMPEP_0175093932 /NCGR_PEP_ID=MMETSP0086_2-20121207/3295_1 /TAXON_ID=136419 /ORGANISM="Unknown Unknown, Strain D1" /LENGTH=308 /DNA_ID=CAMNT_0016366965 /DNA_START=45 /DNA_END=971 /DNA_ORIENTATION=-